MLAAPHLPADAADARARLLEAALRLFAEQGFAKTSIRQLAQAAAVNPAAISYYFGDKQGLYRAAYMEPMGCPLSIDTWNLGEKPTLQGYVTQLVQTFMQPLHRGDQVELSMQLHMREMLDPTGLWERELESDIKPSHELLAQLLCETLNTAQPDDDIHRLALAIASLPLHYYMARDVVQAVRPGLVGTPEAIAQTTQHVVTLSLAMVEAERIRRRDGSATQGVAR